MIGNEDTLYIINPKSKEGNAGKLWKKARKALDLLPREPFDITRVVLKELIAKKNPKLVVIAGGDGTINAVASEVFKMEKKPQLAVIPFGHGNAISYCLGVESIEKAIDVIKNQDHTITVDLLKTNLSKHTIGVFSVSVGFDARIVFNRQHYRYIGFQSYILAGLRSFFAHSEKEITFTIDKKVTLSARASSLVIANCPVIGQNYIVAPNAKMNDGLLDCTLFSTKFTYLTNLRIQGFKHPLYSELGKVRFKASSIRIEGEPYVQIDGDPMVQREGVEIQILPKQLTFLRNKDTNINQMYLPFIT